MGKTTVIRLAAAWVAAVSGLAGGEPTATAVEYYHAGLRSHFLTADPAEIARFDAGRAATGWVRTGGQFGVLGSADDAPETIPVCRLSTGVPETVFYAAGEAECEQARASGAGMFEGVAFYVHAPEGQACMPRTTPVWRTRRGGDASAAGNARYTVDATVAARMVAAGSSADGVVMCAPLAQADIDADAVRLLRQATFGPTAAELSRVLVIGAQAWIDEQLAMPVTPYPEYPWVPANRPTSCVDDRAPPVRPDSYCARDNYTLFPLQLEFFKQAVNQRDQLRARVAFALSQIFVTSGVDNSRNYAMRHYQQLLRERAFGNFYDLLLAVSLSPVMGDYLDMANNNKANPAAGTAPNENYAREILQLFSIGLWRLNPDGTLMLDRAGKPIPTYDMEEIEGFAYTFTGWTYPTLPGVPARNNNPRNYLGSMHAVAANHDFGSKLLLNGVRSPANLTPEQDLAFAHRNIFDHPNVGPFIGKQLIQKLVTSDPTPGYVARVAAVFANNGAGIRGDLRAVVRAILTDPEARGARKIDPGYGKLAEPVLWMTSVARAFGASTDGVFFRAQSAALGQFVFYPASVFNYYPPDYVVPGTTATGPEFGIQTTGTAIARANFATSLVFSAQIARDASVYGSTGTALDFSGWQYLAANPGALVDRLDGALLAGRMSPAMRAAILAAVNAIPATDALGRVRTAAWLTVTSPQFQVER